MRRLLEQTVRRVAFGDPAFEFDGLLLEQRGLVPERSRLLLQLVRLVLESALLLARDRGIELKSLGDATDSQAEREERGEDHEDGGPRDETLPAVLVHQNLRLGREECVEDPRDLVECTGAVGGDLPSYRS